MASHSTGAGSKYDNVTLIECPKCGFQKYIKTKKALDGATAESQTSTCKCGYTSKTIVEKRKFKRHYFKANGSILYERKKGKPENVLITVSDLSRSGVKFQTANQDALNTNDNIIVTFEFSDNKHTSFIKEATVIHIDGETVCAEFRTLCGDIALLQHQDA